MKLFKSFFFILIFLSLSVNFLKAEDKVSYIDIDYVLTNTISGKELLNTLKKEEELKIEEFKSSDYNFKIEENKILAKRNIISKKEINDELKLLQAEFQKYKQEKTKKIEEIKNKRNRNILNFIKLINPIIEQYMSDNSIAILLDKKNIFIASKNYDITKNLITLIDKDIKSMDIE